MSDNDIHIAQGEDLNRIAMEFGVKRIEVETDVDLRKRAIQHRDTREMKRLFDVGLKAANETMETLGQKGGRDPNAPGVASIFSGVAAMIVASKEEIE